MPELPDISVYLEALEARVRGRCLERVVLKNPFLLRTAQPPLEECSGRRVLELRRLGKRIAIGLEGDLWLVLHLMIAGRLHWYVSGHRGRIRPALLYLEFEHGTLTLTEAGTKRRASLHVVGGSAGLAEHERGGLEVFDATAQEFRVRLSARNTHSSAR
jgi:formamidopyrimidine-DNA glycosylase